MELLNILSHDMTKDKYASVDACIAIVFSLFSSVLLVYYLHHGVRMNTSPGGLPKMPSFIAEEPLNSVRVFWLDQKRLIQGKTYGYPTELNKCAYILLKYKIENGRF